MLNPQSIKDIGLKYVDDPGALIPGGEKWGDVVGTSATLNDNGKVPEPLSITMNDNKISWGLHPEGDVIGYRVYRNGQRVASISAGSDLVYTATSGGSYYVTAVDIVGKESAPSQSVATIAKKGKALVNEKNTEPITQDPNEDVNTEDKQDNEDKKPQPEEDKDQNIKDQEDNEDIAEEEE